jgi:ribosome-associated protein
LPPRRKSVSPDSADLAERIARLSLEKKAEDVIIMNLSPLTSMTDYFVICTGGSNMQVQAISEHISQQLKKEKLRPLHIERSSNQEWILVDFVDVVVHIFQPDKRAFYSLEKLWGDAEMREVKDE